MFVRFKKWNQRHKKWFLKSFDASFKLCISMVSIVWTSLQIYMKWDLYKWFVKKTIFPICRVQIMKNTKNISHWWTENGIFVPTKWFSKSYQLKIDWRAAEGHCISQVQHQIFAVCSIFYQIHTVYIRHYSSAVDGIGLTPILQQI